MEPWDESLEDAYRLLTGDKQVMTGYRYWEKEPIKDPDNPLVPYHLTQERVHKYWINDLLVPDGRTFKDAFLIQGRLLGGCLDCLVGLIGTKFDRVKDFNERYKKDGVIWFLEACDLNVFGIRKALWHMEQAGWFQNVKGFLIGRALNGAEMMGLDVYQAVLAVAGKYHVPVVMDADIGHLPPMMPLIVGGYAVVDVKGNEISIDMSTQK
jgi:muramoyltetrapeptide carboxypeptidase LdcA involved in peptidoglycan recycling